MGFPRCLGRLRVANTERAEELTFQPVENFLVGCFHLVIDPVREFHLLEGEHLADQQIGVLVDEDSLGDSAGKEFAGDRSACAALASRMQFMNSRIRFA